MPQGSLSVGQPVTALQQLLALLRLPAWLLLLLVVPPPLKIDYRLITWLQSFTSDSSSLVLEALGVNHMMQGNLLELPGRLLMVEQACSGIRDAGLQDFLIPLV